MYTKFKPFVLIAATPVHPGAGSGLGVIDLPIQRERHTGYPKIEASGIKGVLKDWFREKLETTQLDIILGPEEGDKFESAAGFMDAKVLFFPVKSVNGVFAWVTCSGVLTKFQAAMKLAKITMTDANGDIQVDQITHNRLASNEALIAISISGRKDVVLEDKVVQAVIQDETLDRFVEWFSTNFLVPAGLLQQAEELPSRVLTVTDTIFADLVRHNTEVIARNRLEDESGTVAASGPWYEEYIPEETILYSLCLASRPFLRDFPAGVDLDSDEKVMNALTACWPAVVQLGANATIGKGFVLLALHQPQATRQPSNPENQGDTHTGTSRSGGL